MHCAISGEITSQPVLSPKSHMIFDKTMAESYIVKYGKDPVSEDPMSVEDLISVKTSPSSNNTKNYNSIPSLLTVFQNEWDTIILENFELKKKIKNLQDDLASSVYHYDASIRVISRLSKERDEAVRKLQDVLLGNTEVSKEAVKMDIDDDISPETKAEINAEVESTMEFQVGDSVKGSVKEFPEETVKEISKQSTEESPTGAKVPVSTPESPESERDLLIRVKEADKFLSAIHQKQLKENKSSLNTSKHQLYLKNLFPFTAFENLQIPASNQLSDITTTIFNNELLLVCNRLYVFVLNLSLNSMINKFKISSLYTSQETLTCMNFINTGTVASPNFKPIVGFEDGTVLIIDTDLSVQSLDKQGSTPETVAIGCKASDAAAVSLLVHPSLNNYLIQVYSNGVWNLVDCSIHKELFKSTLDSSASFEYCCADLHMDGSLLAVGTSTGKTLIYDLKTGTKLTTFQEEPEKGSTEDEEVVSNLKFANNGYWLLSTMTSFKGKSSKINIWDLRKGIIITTIKFKKPIKTVKLDKFSQIMTILFQDNTVEFCKYMKRGKQWVGASNLSENFSRFYKPDGKTGVINIFWQKAFDRAFYVVKSNGQWGKYAVDFN